MESLRALLIYNYFFFSVTNFTTNKKLNKSFCCIKKNSYMNEGANEVFISNKKKFKLYSTYKKKLFILKS